MSDQISINQTVPVVSESVSSDNRTTCLFIMEEDRRIIEFRASVANMGFNDYLVAAGYENPLRYQIEQIRSVYPYCEECINRISDIKQEWLHDAFQKEILDMRSCMESLVSEMCTAALPVWPGNTYLNIPTEAATNYEMTVAFTLITLPTQVFNDFTEYAGTLGTDLQSYLLYAATNRCRSFSPAPLETAFPYLRRAGRLLGYISDFGLRKSLLNNITSMWDVFCKSLVIFETGAYQPLSAPCVPSGDLQTSDEESDLLT